MKIIPHTHLNMMKVRLRLSQIDAENSGCVKLDKTLSGEGGKSSSLSTSRTSTCTHAQFSTVCGAAVRPLQVTLVMSYGV